MQPKENRNIVANQNTLADSVSSLTQERATESNAIQIPEISLPNGGGALKGIDEKFEVNAANGTSSFNILLPLTSGRNGFSPSLSLSYNSGGGNSPYGLGWSINHPSIQRRTDKQLPRYRDGLEEDTFMFSGAEDLVPFQEKSNNKWKEKTSQHGNYKVKRYRPRLEGGFAKIEKICHPQKGVYWKVTTRGNVATIFGRNPNARKADPQDASRIFEWLPEFSYDDKGNWIQYHYKIDTNFRDGELVKDESVPCRIYEKNRIKGIAPYTNTYLKRVTYGNRLAYYANQDLAFDPQHPEQEEYFFELVMDYGEHDLENPTPKDSGIWDYREDAFSSYRSGFEIRTNRICKRVLMFHHFKDEEQLLGYKDDGSKIFTPFGKDYLVRSLDFQHQPAIINKQDSKIDKINNAEVVYLNSITQNGYIRKEDGSYSKKSLPPMEFSYQELNWNKKIKKVKRESIINAPVGLSNNYQWVDLYGEGISGILSEQGEGWYYKSNLGDVDEDGDVTFTLAKQVISRPSFLGIRDGTLTLQDLEANGEKQVVVNSPGINGYFELTHDDNWKAFQHFEKVANINLQDPNTRLLDINGDGQPELVMTEENVFTWYTSEGKKGYTSVESTFKSLDEERGPAIVFSDQEQTIFLADVVGDGLTDIVRIRNGEICYWANKGYGKFSAKVTMANAPVFEHDELFNPQYLHLADVSGTGATDIIYLGKDVFKAYINLSGNAWSDAHEIQPFFPIDRNSRLSVVDLLGTGTSCIVWSSYLPSYSNEPMRYIDLMNSKKPHVLIQYKNNFGKETHLEYKSSTHFYLEDKINGKPWITKLPFPVQVVTKATVIDKITDVKFTSIYKYHHGFYAPEEREFRGFGMVEQIDSEHYEEWLRNNATNQLEKEEALYQDPVLTKSWYHTGAFLDRERILTQYKEEYWFEEYNRAFPSSPLNIKEPELCDAIISDEIKSLCADEYREALRACKGIMLRREIFTLDASVDCPPEDELKLQMTPYTVATHNCNIQMLQPREENEYGVFLVTVSEAINIHYERDVTDARIEHTLNTDIDDLGNILESASVVYGRRLDKANTDFNLFKDKVTNFSEDVLNNEQQQKEQLQNAFVDNIDFAKIEQTKTHIIYNKNTFADYVNSISPNEKDLDLPHAYRLRLPFETQTFELTGLRPDNDIFNRSDFENILSNASEIEYQDNPTNVIQKRLIEHVRTNYYSDDFVPLTFGKFDSIGLPFESYQLAYTEELVKDIYSKQDGTELQADGNLVSNFIETKGKYSNINGKLWIRSGITHFKENASEQISAVKKRFYSPLAFEDPFGIITKVIYDKETNTNGVRNNDGYYLYIKETEDAIENKFQIDIFDYRTLSPLRMIDMNANPNSVIMDELGMTKAMAIEGNGVYTNSGQNEVNLIQTADDLSGIKAYETDVEKNLISDLLSSANYNHTNTSQLREKGKQLLNHASLRFIYDFDTYHRTEEQPVFVGTIAREEHFTNNNDSALQFSFEYSDGMGNIAMTKVQAEPGKAYYMENGIRKEKDTAPELRWVGNGRTVLNNKGNPVKQYEPYFSTNFLYEDSPELVEIGVTPILFYDALGRLKKTEFPDESFSKIEFDSWKQISFDQNDTSKESAWYEKRINQLIDAELIEQGKDPIKEKQAAQKAAAHFNTPSMLFLDSLGRPMLNIGDNGLDAQNKSRFYATFIQLDIEGNARTVIDARGNHVMSYKYDILGHRVYQNSMDAGERWVLNNLMGNPIHRWDSRGHVFSFSYDNIQRPDRIKVNGGDGNTPLDHVYEKLIYGEGQTDDYQNNLRGNLFTQFDTAGRVNNLQFDFKGNLLNSSRTFAANYKEVANWTDANINAPNIFDADLEEYFTVNEYDAFNRVTKTIAPDGSITEPHYNEAALLEKVEVTQTDFGSQFFVKNIDYDAKGQREKIVYGDNQGNNLATTKYKYDKETFRLLHLKTTKPNGDVLQDLSYTYDPIGNITEIEDKAIPTQFYAGQKIEGKGIYTYDAVYRLVEAEGREHAGQAINFGQCDNWKDQAFIKNYSPGDDMAWRNYHQKYHYDPVGNILNTRHQANGGNWNRTYEYESQNNRLQHTQVGGETYQYPHHPTHGFIQSLPHLQVMDWNFKDELQAVATQKICTGVEPETTYYVYDGGGQRVRKITENQGGTSKKEERVYLGQTEIYKKHLGNHSGLERTTLHVMDDTRRIAMIDTRNDIDDDTDERTIRFQFSNHLGSSSLELDEDGEIISYEEFHPYGTTAYQAKNNKIKTVAKRYKYSGKERDEESGLYYYGARYVISWLGLWLNPDPSWLIDGTNVYRYLKNNPIKFIDLTGRNAGEPEMYTVQKWDNIWDISKNILGEDSTIPEINSRKNKILEWNQLNADSVIRPGQELIIGYPLIQRAVLYDNVTGELIDRKGNNFIEKTSVWVVDSSLKNFNLKPHWANAYPLTYNVGNKDDKKAGKPTGITGNSLRTDHPLYSRRREVTGNFAMPFQGQVYEEDLMDLTDEFNKILKDGESHFAPTTTGPWSFWFYWQVTDNADYDLKSNSRGNLSKIPSYAAIVIGEYSLNEGRLTRYDDYGNISYGYWGRLYGFGEEYLLKKADDNQNTKNGITTTGVGDELRDKVAIMLGFRKFKSRK